jgi:hypothetical protein
MKKIGVPGKFSKPKKKKETATKEIVKWPTQIQEKNETTQLINQINYSSLL